MIRVQKKDRKRYFKLEVGDLICSEHYISKDLEKNHVPSNPIIIVKAKYLKFIIFSVRQKEKYFYFR